MARSVKELAREALLIQDASNLSGIVIGWARAVVELRENYPDEGTFFFNVHPVNKMWASKVHDLTRMGLSDSTAFEEAYRKTKDLAGEI